MSLQDAETRKVSEGWSLSGSTQQRGRTGIPTDRCVKRPFRRRPNRT